MGFALLYPSYGYSKRDLSFSHSLCDIVTERCHPFLHNRLRLDFTATHAGVEFMNLLS